MLTKYNGIATLICLSIFAAASGNNATVYSAAASCFKHGYDYGNRNTGACGWAAIVHISCGVDCVRHYRAQWYTKHATFSSGDHSPESCAADCRRIRGCKFFTWKQTANKGLHNVCFLKTGVHCVGSGFGNPTSLGSSIVSGPRECKNVTQPHSNARQPHVGTKQTSGGLPYGRPRVGKRYPHYNGFTLYLVEEFDQPIDLMNDKIWTYSDGSFGGSSVRFVKDAISFRNGKMRITMSRRSQRASCSHAESHWAPYRKLTSGEMRTRHNIFRYGRYEVRMRAPHVQPGNPYVHGDFTSSFFVFRDGKFRTWREIDFEILGTISNRLQTNLLYGNNKNRWGRDFEQAKLNYLAPHSNVRKEFHTYAIEWLPNSIKWFIDGKLVRKHRSGWGKPKLPVPELSTKIMMNLWGRRRCHWPGCKGRNNRYPMYAEYDWVRFYKWNGDNHYPCNNLDPNCLTSADKYMSSNNACEGTRNEGGFKACVGQCHNRR